jgi:sulfofructosephosphate aldolase
LTVCKDISYAEGTFDDEDPMPLRDTTALYDAIARPGGGFAMVALDARESMRALFRDSGRADEDADLSDFKELAVHQVAATASAVLCDPRFGGAAIEAMRREHPTTGLIVAVDRFDEPRYGPLAETYLDVDAMDAAVAGGGVSALKLYLFWRPNGQPHFRADDARRFVEHAHELGVLALLEGVVTSSPDHPGFDDALVRAAEDFGAFGPDVYKTQLPTFGRGDDETVEREARRITDAVGVPWVVLSNGVQPDRFVSAVAAACRGGASGLLAGRGVWRAALDTDDPEAELASGGQRRLRALVDVVDSEARPWREAVPH